MNKERTQNHWVEVDNMQSKDILRKELNEDLIILGVALKQAYADFDSYLKLEAEWIEKVLALNKLIEE